MIDRTTSGTREKNCCPWVGIGFLAGWGLFLLVIVTSLVHFSFTIGSETDDLQRELIDLVHEQSKAWNEGDIDTFMKAYWQDDGLTFSSGGEVHRGWTTTRDRYKSRYPDRKTMGTLRFDHLEVQPLGEGVALMLGDWHLERERPVGGNFTLVWRKMGGEWVIIHDHSSSKPSSQ